jgi:WD40 repeat protein/serine/threonine protein kinase
LARDFAGDNCPKADGAGRQASIGRVASVRKLLARFEAIARELSLLSGGQVAQAGGECGTDSLADVAAALQQRGWITAEDCGAIGEILLAEGWPASDVGPLLLWANSPPRSDLTHSDPGSETSRRAGTIAEDMLDGSDDEGFDVAGDVALDGQPGEELPQLDGQRYSIRRLFAEGGLSRVWVAHDGNLNREVALKQMRPDLRENAIARKRFHREAQITGQLEHPHIVPVYELGHESDHHADRYYAMRLVRGTTLGDACRRHHEQRRLGQAQPLEMPRLLHAFVSVCQAIAYAHSRGVIHRDIKPDNVILGDYGEVIVLDWGLAKTIGEGTSFSESSDELTAGRVLLTDSLETEQTLTEAVLGTPAFMAPEQALPRLGPVDERTDIYGLGATLFMILTGAAPHRGRSVAATLDDVVRNPVRRTRDVNPLVPRPLEAICGRATSYDPAQRYERVADLAEDVQKFLADEPVSAYKYPLRTRIQRWVKRRRVLVSTAAALLTTATLALAIGNLLLQTEQARTDAARRSAEQLAQEMTLDRGLLLCQQGQIGAGLLWLSRCLEMLPDDAERTDKLVRTAIASWRRELTPVQRIVDAGRGVLDVRFAPEQPLLMTSSESGLVQFWHGESGDKVGSPIRHEHAISRADFPGNDRVLTIDQARTIRLWDRATGEVLLGPLSIDNEISTASYSPASRRLFVGCQNGRGYLWDADSRNLVAQPFGHDMQVMTAVFSDDGGWLAIGDANNQAVLRNSADGLLATPPLRHANWVVAIAFSPDGQWLATGGYDNCVKLWNIERCRGALTGGDRSGVCEPDRNWVHRGQIRSLRFSPDSKTVLTLAADKTARLWNVQTGEEVCPPLVHRGVPTTGYFLARRSLVITGASDNVVRTWDPATGLPAAPDIQLASGLKAFDVSADESRLVTLEQDGRVAIWSLERPDSAWRLEHGEIVYAVEFSSDGRALASGGAGQGDTVALWSQGDSRAAPRKLPAAGFVFDLAAVPGTRQIVTGGTQSWLRRWDLDRGVEVLPGIPGESPITGIAVSHDGKYVARVAWDNLVRVFDLATGDEIGSPRSSPGGRAIAFHPGRYEFATGGGDGVVRIWNALESLEPERVIPHPGMVRDLEYGHAGKRLATACQDRLARLFDVETGAVAEAPLRHEGAVNAVAFAADDSILATACDDGSARLWDVALGKEISAPFWHAGPVLAVAFRPDGQQIATGSSDRMVRVWPLPRPIANPVGAIRLENEALTGLTLDERGNLQSLDAAAWQLRR